MMTLLDEGLYEAVTYLLAEALIVTAVEIEERVALTDRASPQQGARMVAKAWVDADYRALLLRDGTAAAEALGIAMLGLPPLGVLENQPGLHHLVVCTLCSCYPRAVLGTPPFWFKSAAYRARAVRDPRGVLAEWNTTLPDDTRVRVVDSTADYRWMVLPMRPEGTEALSEDVLATLVDEGDMIGVTLPRAPV
ncbi:nitrile hydratase subunit alpha [Lichenicoccus sp.]|uniref:nitrile hydratase subunit alpha n=1 Tax=Lichenicoccus sp. TaxID=2781899 RepID=UPI003D0DA15C